MPVTCNEINIPAGLEPRDDDAFAMPRASKHSLTATAHDLIRSVAIGHKESSMTVRARPCPAALAFIGPARWSSWPERLH